MKNILWILVCVFACVLIVLSIFLNREIKKTSDLSVEKEQLSTEKEQLLKEKENLLSASAFRNGEILFNGKDLNKETSITDGKGNSVELSEIINGNKLVFYFSESSCDMCVNIEIARLNEKTDLIISDNTIILINATYKRYVAQYKNNNNLRFPVYEIISKKEDLPSIPLYFVIDKASKRINSAFFPSKYTQDETDKYLAKIAEDYFR
jgi:hypothetical protein